MVTFYRLSLLQFFSMILRSKFSQLKNTVEMSRITFIIGLTLLISCSKTSEINLEANMSTMSRSDEMTSLEYVHSQLKEMYPSLGSYQVEEENDEFEAVFKLGGNDLSVFFDEMGNWKESKVDIRYNYMINDEVMESINNSEFGDMVIKEKDLYQNRDTLYYKIEFSELDREADKDVEWDVYFTKGGMLLKKEKKTIERKN